MSIPKMIHYCWFGGNPLPQTARRCIASWKKYLPDYEIKEWNESNFNVNAIHYTAEAYANKKYAFVSDYARFWILYHFGGVYFDTDVEVTKPLSPILDHGAYLGFEARSEGSLGVNPGLGAAAEPYARFYAEMLDLYASLKFDISENIVTHTTAAMVAHGLVIEDRLQTVCGVTVYPSDYFCPMNYDTRKVVITGNTYTVHHYDESWLPKRTKFINAFGRLVGPGLVRDLVELKKKLHK